MDYWRSVLTFDPLKKLLSSNDELLTARVKRDLSDEEIPYRTENKEIRQIIKRQQPDGSWIFRSTSKKKYPSINHDLVETFKSLRILTGKYELNRNCEAITNCAAYIFGCQTDEGDIRGILGNQYMPYYCGLLVELLILAGYGNDDRIDKAVQWLISVRQNDGGWVVPLQTLRINKFDDSTYAAPAVYADKTLPFSHMTTGMVLRAFAVHRVYKKSEPAIKAGELLKSRFFKPDKYFARKSPEYWVKFQFPYWWTTILSSLDSLYHLGFTVKDKDVEKGIEWFLANQDESGLWAMHYDKGDKDKIESARLWVSYNICRILKMYLN
ncbi:MAG TPA: prenyltransferase/squalene oxidase repeat-containing protein [Bacteroidales bacterium]|nr:prenyltransferase/squalene oxidase repeat-containing protein [Bacteroidales bacterium]